MTLEINAKLIIIISFLPNEHISPWITDSHLDATADTVHTWPSIIVATYSWWGCHHTGHQILMRRDSGLWLPQRALRMENQSWTQRQRETVLLSGVPCRLQSENPVPLTYQRWQTSFGWNMSVRFQRLDSKHPTLKYDNYQSMLNAIWNPRNRLSFADYSRQKKFMGVSCLCTYTTWVDPFLRRRVGVLLMEGPGTGTEEFCAPCPASS